MNAAALIEPLPAVAGCGEDLALTPAFDAVARLREEDDAGLAQGEWRRAPRVADWAAVLHASGELLATATKDLRPAGWWLEAAAHLHGPAGLADGVGLVAALVERWGDELHPRVDGSEAEARIGALRWLLALVARLASTAPLLHIGRRPIGAGEADAARRRGDEVGGDPADDRCPPGIVAIRRAAAAAGAPWLEAGRAGWRDADAALSRLQALCDARLGAESPSFVGGHAALDMAASALERLGREAGIATAGARDPGIATAGAGTGIADATRAVDLIPGAAADDATTTASPAAAATPSPLVRTAVVFPESARLVDGRPGGRDEALRQLQAVAAFFRATEPHSPVAYLAEKAVRWGTMPLHLWLREVLGDDPALARLEQTLGTGATGHDR